MSKNVFKPVRSFSKITLHMNSFYCLSGICGISETVNYITITTDCVTDC